MESNLGLAGCTHAKAQWFFDWFNFSMPVETTPLLGPADHTGCDGSRPGPPDQPSGTRVGRICLFLCILLECFGSYFDQTLKYSVVEIFSVSVDEVKHKFTALIVVLAGKFNDKSPN